MKLKKIPLATYLLLFSLHGYAQSLTGPLLGCRIETEGKDSKVTSFTRHPDAGEMTYASSNEKIAKIDLKTGVIDAISIGLVTITATQKASTTTKGDTKSCSLNVVAAPSTLTWSVADQEATYKEGGPVEIKIQAPVSSTKRPITYTSDKPHVANFLRVSDGQVIIKIVAPSNGTWVTFTAQQAGDGKYNENQATFKLKIMKEGGITFTPGNDNKIPSRVASL